MTISVDTSVARFSGLGGGHGAGPISASFTPANGSLLVVCVNADEFDGTSNKAVTVTTASGTAITFTERVRRGATESGAGIASIWTGAGAGNAVTIQADYTASGAEGSGRVSAKIYIVTGQHASPIGNTNSADFTTDPQNLSLTAAGAGRLFGCGTDWNANGSPTSTDTADAAHYASQISVMSAFKSADHVSGSQQINFNPAGTPTGNLAILEILSAAAPSGGFLNRNYWWDNY